MLIVREAVDADTKSIRDIFYATYGDRYAYRQYYDADSLRRLVYTDDTLLLVAEDTDSGRVVGTASVVMDVAAYEDLVGEMGRLAVHPDFRGRGFGLQLMEQRIKLISDRLHLGLVENRTTHQYSQRISLKHGFRPFGFVPMKMRTARREHVSLHGRFFGDALVLRRNNPCIVPEVYPLACVALANSELPCDCIVDDYSPPFPWEEDFEQSEMSSQSYASLLRIERGRVWHREVFGSMRLHYGLFKLRSRNCHYLVARRNGAIAGAIGYRVDESEGAVCIFELISLNDEPIRFLLSELIAKSREIYRAAHLQIDVNAHSPRLQRTLLELGFLPVGYIPARAFHRVERVDAVRMTLLLVPFEDHEASLVDGTRHVAELVLNQFRSQAVAPKVVAAVSAIRLFEGLNEEQVQRLAEICVECSYKATMTILEQGQSLGDLQIVLQGEVQILRDGSSVGEVVRGECLGEGVLLADPKERHDHQATAIAKTRVEAACLSREPLQRLIRRRPDIGVVLYRNLAAGLAHKLMGTDRLLSD